MKARLQVFPTPERTWDALASAWRAAAGEAVERRGFFSAALSGGRSPAGFYRRLARERLPWGQTHLFQVDERFVPPGSPESNARLLAETLLAGLPGRPGGVHLVDTMLESPGAAARAYEEEILGFFSSRGGAAPSFDLVLLGIGGDGHTASLFPGADALEERGRLVAPVPAAGGRLARVTLTLGAINRARAAAFLATGEGKREILARLLGGGEPGLPAALVRPAGGVPALYADAAAGPPQR